MAHLEAGGTRLSAKAAGQRLEALGYADPVAALRHLEALASGVTRKAAIQRTLLPVLLAWFADSADPDAGLLNFRKVSDALGKTPWYLRLLRDEGAAARTWPASCRPAAWPPTCCCARPRRSRCSAPRTACSRAAGPPWSRRCRPRSAARRMPSRPWRRPAAYGGGSCSVRRRPT
ncbi:Bifunctional glutamine synthetase adenylyltransferase/adenylyl-removing enzyme [Streptomyces rimosus subsp. rimosus]